ncbi:HET-domain-containing protein [Trametes versicolor FP-101664 SS1]|uniref:HET-domain-containing protein n=1 Tax=Trametes versicolor (strain FP-101664) TaxID=717944 RepID=UPI00046235EB|nr:HET-domain-containing protein [Trametes versicolor FP-101664 SS1]EIW52261.1 HET-domain-containing protein [Trametes versicolor FP-101664 SS1]
MSINVRLSTFLTTSSDDPAAPYIACDPITDIGSTHALSLAKALIDECVHGHERCKHISPSSDVRLPTRLLDCTDLAFPCLVSTEGQDGIYVALSYVWGEAQPHKTTNSNKSIYSAGIDASLLPQTIRDAIYVAHTLGFRYLWVDSLCIIQDSDEDKLHEIGRMHLIYRHAYLTIIAASAERASDGFLQDRPTPRCIGTLPFICPPHRPIPGDESSRGKQHMAVGEVHLFDAWSYQGSQALEEPVDRRAWCLQELLMSTRALIFESRTLWFRCPKTYQNVNNSLEGKYDEVRLPDIALRPEPPLIRSGSIGNHYTSWMLLVWEYSNRTIGKASDKLVACGALAEAFHRILGCDYLAGSWRDTLLQDLLWHTLPHSGKSGYHFNTNRPLEYRAPSWSWAAVDGCICHITIRSYDHSDVVRTQVMRCHVTLKDPELPFGEVTGGSLVLRAKLIPCKVRRTDTWEWGAEILLPPLLCGRRSGGLHQVDEDVTIAEDENCRLAFCYVDHLPDLLNKRESAWLLPVWWQDRDRFVREEVSGLILTLANLDSGTGAQNGKVYRRIGAFKSICHDWAHLRRLHALEEEEEVEIV